MTHLEVQPDGRIFVIDGMPEEPNIYDYGDEDVMDRVAYKVAKSDYDKALASAPRILCADQVEAQELIRFHCDIMMDHRPTPRIYQVPVEWEKEVTCKTCGTAENEDCKNGPEGCDFKSEQVAILKESPAPLNLNAVGRKFDRLLQSTTKEQIESYLSEESPKEESQEELWAKVIFDARHYNGTPHDLSALTNHFKKQFTITRNSQKP